LTGDARADVVVVGLGAAGLAAALRLRELDRSVIAIDAGAVGGGASGRNGGFLLAGLADFHHRAADTLGRERATALYRLTLDEIERAAARFPDAVRRVGSLRIATSPDELADCQAQERAMRRDGLDVEPYDGPHGQGLRFPGDASLQPLRRCLGLAREAVAAGARLFEHTPAVRVEGARVRTPGGTITGDAVVVCVDGGLEKLLPELSGRVRTARAQMLATASDPGVRIPCPVYARWGYDYWQQLPDGRVALGGCRDLGGDAEWTAEAAVSEPVQEHLERLLRERLGVTAPVTHRWAGVIAFADSPLPVLTEARERVFAAGAYRGTGNALGPIYGRAAADLAATGHTPHLALLTSRS
jgi:glycine/D-amino acid oxidase-like deaminating enzyme